LLIALVSVAIVLSVFVVELLVILVAGSRP